MVLFLQLLIFHSFILVLGCTSGPLDSSRHSTTNEMAFGYIQVEASGWNPRLFPTELRFFFLNNTETNEKFRIDVNSGSKAFTFRLPPGKYSVDRVQFNEGPFMAESNVQFKFQVLKEKATFLGIWKFEVQTPRTVRMARIHFFEGDPEFQKRIFSYLVAEGIAIETVLPEPEKLEARVFSVAPIPKVKYFNR